MNGLLFERVKHLPAEELLLYSEAVLRQDWKIRFTCIKHLLQKKDKPAINEVPAGSVKFVQAAIKAAGLEIPPVDYYPECLKPWLYRHVYRTDLKTLYHRADENRMAPTFVKPTTHKKFNGQVVSSAADIQQLQVGLNTPVWCSDVVTWLTEYRIYVVNRQVRHVGWYWGDEAMELDINEVNRALETMWAANYYITNFCIDFGVLSTGETALIEMGDGYSMGAYGISGKDYLELVTNWWAELTSIDML